MIEVRANINLTDDYKLSIDLDDGETIRAAYDDWELKGRKPDKIIVRLPEITFMGIPVEWRGGTEAMADPRD